MSRRPPLRRPATASDAALERVVGGLGSISLGELEAAAGLMTRVDRKYVVPPGAVAALMGALARRAAVLEIAGSRRFHYRSRYFDTPDLASYRGAAMGRRQRFKVRTRVYGDQGTCVLEVKTPSPRGETVKERMPYDPVDRDRLTVAGRAFVDERTGRAGLGLALRPVLVTTYLRSTLVDRVDGARVTMDRRLTCTDGRGGVHLLGGHVVLETKSAGSATAADRWLWGHGLRPVKISKFCVGMALADPALPANKWNRVLRRYFEWVPAGRTLPPALTA